MLLYLKFIISCLQETLISYKAIMSCQTTVLLCIKALLSYQCVALIYQKTSHHVFSNSCHAKTSCYYGRPWPAVYINFVLKIHQIQVLTEPLCRAQASFYALPNNERGTKYRGLTYSARQNCP